jgi:cell division protein ZapA (FtsZ GTPase activity inhibitor)
MILKLNGLESETYIYPNQEILIPNKNYNFYITKQGDTITSVAEELNENVVDLLNKNETLFLEEDQLIIYR